jgi:dihydrofolate reductase
MRKVIAGLFVSLDGVVEAPETWHLPYFNDEMGEIVGTQAAEADAILLGRVTYQEFAGFWPNQPADDAFAAGMNASKKYVASTTLGDAEWQNSEILRGDLGDAVRAVKALPGRDIQVIGSPTLVRSLLRQGLLDELRLLVHPIVVGSGTKLFTDEAERIPLQLTASRTLATGVLSLTYVPAPDPAETGATETAAATAEGAAR